MHLTAAAAPDPAAVFVSLGFWSLFVIAYWVPTFIALVRHVQARGQVIVVNLFLGWTGIGWVVALVMAFRTAQARPVTPPAFQQHQGQPYR